jgi:hypothetical protein
MVLAPTVETRMQRYLAETPKEKYGAHRYTLEQFGLHQEEERQRYRAYRERFLAKTPLAAPATRPPDSA